MTNNLAENQPNQTDKMYVDHMIFYYELHKVVLDHLKPLIVKWHIKNGVTIRLNDGKFTHPLDFDTITKPYLDLNDLDKKDE